MVDPPSVSRSTRTLGQPVPRAAPTQSLGCFFVLAGIKMLRAGCQRKIASRVPDLKVQATVWRKSKKVKDLRHMHRLSARRPTAPASAHGCQFGTLRTDGGCLQATLRPDLW